MNRLAHTLIGLGVYLATVRKNRPEWYVFHYRHTGRWVLGVLNAEAERRELAARHAKPSTRKRIG